MIAYFKHSSGTVRYIRIYINDHSVGHSLGELSILSEDLICHLVGKQSANSDEFRRLVLVSLAEIVHELAKGELVERFRRLGHSFDSRREGIGGHPVGKSKLRDRRDNRG